MLYQLIRTITIEARFYKVSEGSWIEDPWGQRKVRRNRRQDRIRRSIWSCWSSQISQSLFHNLLVYKDRTKHSTNGHLVFNHKTIPVLEWAASSLTHACCSEKTDLILSRQKGYHQFYHILLFVHSLDQVLAAGVRLGHLSQWSTSQ